MLALVVFGCSSEKDVVRLDPGLSASELRQGKVAVLGAVKFQEPDQVRPPLLRMLETTFASERKDIPLVRADSVRHALGPERQRQLLLTYEYQGSLDDAALREIADSLRGAARFLLAARIDKDRTRSSARGMTEPDTSRARPNFEMGVTGRDAHVTVSLYDLTRRSVVVTGTYWGSSENTKPVLARPDQGVMVYPKGGAPTPDDAAYPDAPDLARAVEGPFREFAKGLPGGKP